MIHKAFPQARHQKCVTLLKRNIQTKIIASDKDALAEDLREVLLTGQRNYTRLQALDKFNEFTASWGGNTGL